MPDLNFSVGQRSLLAFSQQNNPYICRASIFSENLQKLCVSFFRVFAYNIIEITLKGKTKWNTF